MRYLNKREDFLKQKKHIQGVPYETLLEVTSSAGPFANDVGINDSWLGRIINHGIRKAVIAYKIPKIKDLSERLEEEFEQIVGQSKIYTLSSDDQRLTLRIELDVFFKELIYAVENNSEVNVLKGLTDGCIRKVTNMADFDKKDVLLEELKKFRDFLDQFKNDDTLQSQEEEEDKPTNVNTQEIPFDFCIKNLKAVYAILIAYKKLKEVNKQEHFAKKDAAGQEVEVGKEYTYNDKVVKVINKDHTQVASTDKAWLTRDDKIGEPLQNPQKDVFIIWKLGDKNYPPNTTGQAVDSTKLKPLTESNETVTPAPVATAPTKVAGIFSAIKPVYTYFTSDKDIFPGLESLFKMSPENQQKYGFKAPILKIYNTARLNEDLKQFLSRPEAIGKSLITMYKSTKVKEDGSFEGIQADMKLAIADFNKTMKAILQFQSGIGEKPKKEGEETDSKTEKEGEETDSKTEKEDDIDFENKNRSDFSDSVKLLKYTSFMRINEADEADKTDDVDDASAKILEFFNKTCIEVRAYTVSKEERDVIIKKIETVKTDGKKIEMTIDPIIEIMNLFIKAYKLYTVKTITKRTENVDTNTLSEYTSFGAQSTDDTGRSGPYRNNKLFDIWEKAVNDIRKNRKYQAIFTDNANLRLPKVTNPDPTDPEDWTIKPKAGSSFRKFINDVLDGSELYKSGTTSGSVATFIERYFGDGSVSEGSAKDIDTTTLAGNAELEEQISANSTKLKLKTENVITPTPNTFFMIHGMASETDPTKFTKDTQVSFFIDKVDASGVVWLIATKNLLRFKPLLDLLSPRHDISSGDFTKTLTIDTSGEIYYTKVSGVNFRNMIKGKTISLAIVNGGGNKPTPALKSIQITNVYSLVGESGVYAVDRTKFNDILKNKSIKFDSQQVVINYPVETKVI